LNVQCVGCGSRSIGIVEIFGGSNVTAIPAGATRIARVKFHVLDELRPGTSKVAFDNSVVNGFTSDVEWYLACRKLEGGEVSIASSAGVSVSGRVTSSDGRGIRGCDVTIVDGEAMRGRR